MERGIFITATGTDVGKTFISALWINEMKKRGISAGYFKPALSGAAIREGKLLGGDAHYVCKAAGLFEEPETLVSYAFEKAVSPHLAARLEHKRIEKEKIQTDFQKVKQRYDYIVVEGCGGIVCPLCMEEERLMLSDIMRMLNLELLIVSPSGLGAINNTVLAAEFAKHCHLPVKGILLNYYEKGNPLHEDNRRQIELLSGIPVIAVAEKGAESLEFCTKFE